MAWYLRFEWAILFVLLLGIGGIGFYFWLRKEQSDIHVNNHFALALACRAVNQNDNGLRRLRARPGYLAKWVEIEVLF